MTSCGKNEEIPISLLKASSSSLESIFLYSDAFKELSEKIKENLKGCQRKIKKTTSKYILIISKSIHLFM